MDLSTRYLGKTLRNPIVVSASPLTRSLNKAKALEDAGAAAIVMESVFEEQIDYEAAELDYYLFHTIETYAEHLSYFPFHEEYLISPDAYLEHIYYLKKSLDIPVIASVNGASTGRWLTYASDVEQAGADALELNIYQLPTNTARSGADVEKTYIQIVENIKSTVNIPVAVKISPYFSSMAYTAQQFVNAGADALVLFNRFYQPDINLETMEVTPNIMLSTAYSMRLPLRWIAILFGRIETEFAATSGIHTAEDVLKMLMVGANVTMMCSAILKNGPDYISKVLKDLGNWMEANEQESVRQLQGIMGQISCADPAAFERANYMKALKSY